MRSVRIIPGILCTAGILMLLGVGGLKAQYLEVRTTLDTNQIRIGEDFHLEMEVSQPPQIRVNLPVPQGDTLIDKIEILETYPPDSTWEGEMLKIRQRLKLTSFDSGLYVIPPLEFHFRSSTWNDSIRSNPLYLMVHSVAVDSTIYDIKAPIHVPVGFAEVYPYVLGALLLIALTGMAVWYFRRRRAGSPVFGPPKPSEPAHVIALRELDELKADKLWQRNEFKSFYTRLTGIIRRYIERRYGIPAMEMTSHDTLEAWSQINAASEELTGGLHRLLNLADLVKFAKEKPLATENEAHLDMAYHFIRHTKQEVTGSITDAGDAEKKTDPPQTPALEGSAKGSGGQAPRSENRKEASDDG